MKCLSTTPHSYRISKLGSGSDFEAYFIRLGIAAGRARYTKNKVMLAAWCATCYMVAWLYAYFFLFYFSLARIF